MARRRSYELQQLNKPWQNQVDMLLYIDPATKQPQLDKLNIDQNLVQYNYYNWHHMISILTHFGSSRIQPHIQLYI